MKLKDLMEEVNKDGNGRTTTTSNGPNHKHYIKNWKALSSEDGHRHVVKKS